MALGSANEREQFANGPLVRYEAKAKRLFRKIERDLKANAPDVDAYDWPEPKEGDEDARQQRAADSGVVKASRSVGR